MSPRATDVDRAAGRRIRERRIMLGLTQEELGELIGVSYQQFHKYETGMNRLSIGRMLDICRVLATSPAELLTDIAAAPRASRARERAQLEIGRNVALLAPRTRQALAALLRALVVQQEQRP